MKGIHLIGAAVTLAVSGVVSGMVSAPPVGVVADTFGGGFNSVVGVIPLPDGRVLAWERIGKLWMIGPDGVRAPGPVLDISDEVQGGGDQGMLGVALHPDFPSKPYIYALYVVDRHHLLYAGTPQYSPSASLYYKATIARVVRFTLDASSDYASIVPGSRCTLLGATREDGIPILHSSHSVGSLVFGQDGTLLVTTGDNASYSVYDTGGSINNPNVATALKEGIIRPEEDVGAFRSQLLNTLCGKVLRIDPDSGDGVASNPWFQAAAPRSPQSRVWALGLRNPYRAVMVPDTGSHDPDLADPGVLLVVDVGAGVAEELNVIKRGGLNLGWPLFEGQMINPYYWRLPVRNSDVSDPQASWVTFQDLIVQDTQFEQRFINSDRVQQAESAPRSASVEYKNYFGGFSGSGYAFLPAAAWIETTQPVSGSGALMIRYSNPSATDSVVTAQIPGQAGQAVRLPTTGHQDAWRIHAVPFSTGGAAPAAIRLTKASGPSLFIDAIWIEQEGVTPDLPSSALTYVHHRPVLDWRVARTTTPGFNAQGAAIGVSLGAEGGAEGQPFTGICGVGVAVVDGEHWPAEHRGIYFGDYGGGWIRRAVLSLGSRCGASPGNCNCSRVESVSEFDLEVPSVVGLTSSPFEPTLFSAQWTTLRRYRWLPGGSAAPVVRVTQSAQFGPSPLSVTFDATSSFDPEGSPLEFRWEFSDGHKPLSGPVVQRAFANPGTGPASVRVTLSVTDDAGVTASEELMVGLDNTPPLVRIASVTDGQLYPTDVDTVFPLSADVTDLEHGAADIDCEWRVTLHHNTHVHPEPPDSSCVTSATIQATHCDDDNTYWYEITLTATDAAGLRGSDTVVLQPDCNGTLNCVGDLTRNGSVDAEDLGALISQWGGAGSGDLNRDGFTNGLDIAVLLNNWGVCKGH